MPTEPIGKQVAANAIKLETTVSAAIVYFSATESATARPLLGGVGDALGASSEFGSRSDGWVGLASIPGLTVFPKRHASDKDLTDQRSDPSEADGGN